MSRTNVPITPLVANTLTADPAGTALDATNSHNVGAGAAGVECEELLLRIVNTTNATKVATVKAGHNPPADAAGQGDIAVSLVAGNVTPTVAWVGPFTSARFIQADGSINVDVGAGMTGTITAFAVPRSA